MKICSCIVVNNLEFCNIEIFDLQILRNTGLWLSSFSCIVMLIMMKFSYSIQYFRQKNKKNFLSTVVMCAKVIPELNATYLVDLLYFLAHLFICKKGNSSDK